MDKLTWAKNYFHNDIFATNTTGIEILKAEENYAKCLLNIKNSHMNANNSVMGGVIFTLADFCFAVASNSEHKIVPTISTTINFLSVSKGAKLFAETTCIKSGKSICVYTINITDEFNHLIAICTSTGKVSV